MQRENHLWDDQSARLKQDPTDTLREYLRSISHYTTLRADEELVLSRDVERWTLLKEIRKRLVEQLNSDPSVSYLASILISNIFKELFLLRTLGRCAKPELPLGTPLSVLLRDSEVRKIMDSPVSECMCETISDEIGVESGEVPARIADLSKLVNLIPVQIITTMEDALWPDLYRESLESIHNALKGQEREIENWWSIIEERGEAASELMIKQNLRLVVAVAKKYIGFGIPVIDLIQEGNLGLMQAVERYNPHFGYRFSTFAIYWIMNSITRTVGEYDYSVREAFIKTITQDIPYDDVAKMVTNKDIDVLTERLMKALENLPPRSRMVFALTLGLIDGRPRSYEEVGMELGLAQEHVHQLECEAIAMLSLDSVELKIASELVRMRSSIKFAQEGYAPSI